MALEKKEEDISEEPSAERIRDLQEIQLATFNILEDFNAEKLRAEETQRAVLNILDDFGAEWERAESTQKATLNILDDFNAEKGQLESTQRAVLNILEDFTADRERLETTQKATLNILDDFNAEKGQLESTQRAVLNILEDLNTSNEGLKEAHDVLEARVAERTAALEQSLKEKEVLLREIHHRVKNNLQIIHSMLNLQLPQVTDRNAIELFKESQNRVYSMALIHEKLYQSESMAMVDFPEYIRGLVSYLFVSYGVAGNTILPVIEVEDVSLDIDTAIPCALIINELVSNALKHAFPAARGFSGGGRVEVSLHRGDGRILLSVGDNGIGMPENFEIERLSSLGLKLVKVLVNQLRGTLDISSREGARFSIAFPPLGTGKSR